MASIQRCLAPGACGRIQTGWPAFRCAKALCAASDGAGSGVARSWAATGRATGLSLSRWRLGQCAEWIRQRRALSSARNPRTGPAISRVQAIRNAEDSVNSTHRTSFWERLAKAWKILFPPPTPRASNADLAKERLRLVLYSDRGEVSQAVRNKLRQHIIDAISSYVDITDEDEVQLSVAADPSLGAVYSVTIPVRRVKPEFQEYWSDTGFRDRFYEEILREQGGEPGVARIEVETRMLDVGDN